jgi:hypothetical protein
LCWCLIGQAFGVGLTMMIGRPWASTSLGRSGRATFRNSAAHPEPVCQLGGLLGRFLGYLWAACGL